MTFYYHCHQNIHIASTSLTSAMLRLHSCEMLLFPGHPLHILHLLSGSSSFRQLVRISPWFSAPARLSQFVADYEGWQGEVVLRLTA